jgi:hypothetical protein
MAAPQSFKVKMRAPQVAATLLFLALVACLGESARAAEQRYIVSGRDSFAIGEGDIKSETRYDGTEVLTVTRRGKAMRYAARVTYVRNDQGAASDAVADFVSDLLPTGEQLDSADHDPDYLTVLNQPFSAQLDAATLEDLKHLHGTVPFDFPSPFTGATLHGSLAGIGAGRLGGRPAIGVRFSAGGPMHGALPDRPGLTLSGGILMRGTAYYDSETALLLTLDATVTISGNVSNRTGKDPVTIVYRRLIRADRPDKTRTAQRTR